MTLCGNYDPCLRCRDKCNRETQEPCERYKRYDELLCEMEEVLGNIEALRHITRGETEETTARCIKEALDKNIKRLEKIEGEIRTI